MRELIENMQGNVFEEIGEAHTGASGASGGVHKGVGRVQYRFELNERAAIDGYIIDGLGAPKKFKNPDAMVKWLATRGVKRHGTSVARGRQNKVLAGHPTFDDLAGPMMDGRMIRYEPWDMYEGSTVADANWDWLVAEETNIHWAFGYVIGSYTDVKRAAAAYGLHTKSIKKALAGKYFRSGRSIMRIRGSKSSLDGFLGDWGGRFQQITIGDGPSPAGPDSAVLEHECMAQVLAHARAGVMSELIEKKEKKLWLQKFKEQHGIESKKAHPDHCVHSIGFSEKEQKWYGWNHRALCGFGIGDMIFEPEFGDDKTPFVKHGSKKIKNMKDAEKAARAFADDVL